MQGFSNFILVPYMNPNLKFLCAEGDRINTNQQREIAYKTTELRPL